jgi:curved DNA-binding protein CbpA
VLDVLPFIGKILAPYCVACADFSGMPDHFAILAQPRRPWLDDEALKEAFHRASAQQHPDVAGGGGENASALNAAYAALRDPASRLRHLLELEWPGAAPARAAIAPALAELFGKIAALRQVGAALAKRASAAQTPLARALLAGDHATHRRALEATLAELAAAEAAAHDDLRAIDAQWAARDDRTRDQLTALQQSFAFLAKWQAQLREDLFRLGA